MRQIRTPTVRMWHESGALERLTGTLAFVWGSENVSDSPIISVPLSELGRGLLTPDRDLPKPPGIP